MTMKGQSQKRENRTRSDKLHQYHKVGDSASSPMPASDTRNAVAAAAYERKDVDISQQFASDIASSSTSSSSDTLFQPTPSLSSQQSDQPNVAADTGLTMAFKQLSTDAELGNQVQSSDDRLAHRKADHSGLNDIPVSALPHVPDSVRRQHPRIALPSIQTRFNLRNRSSKSNSQFRGKGSSSSQSTSGFSNGAYSSISTPYTTFDSQIDSPEAATALTTPSSSVMYHPSYQYPGSDKQKRQSEWNDLQEDDEAVLLDSDKVSWPISPAQDARSSSFPEGQDEITLIDVATLRSWLDEVDNKRGSHRSRPKKRNSTVNKIESSTSGRPTTNSDSNIDLDTPNTNKTLIGKFPDQILGPSKIDETNPIPDGNVKFRTDEKDLEGLGRKRPSESGTSLSYQSSGKADLVWSSPTPPSSTAIGSQKSYSEQSLSQKYPHQDGLDYDIDTAREHLTSTSTQSLTTSTLQQSELGPLTLASSPHFDSRPFILLITSSLEKALSHSERILLVKERILHIAIPRDHIDGYTKGVIGPADFIDLSPFLTDEMSKRKFSAMSLDREEGLQSYVYWRSDLVIIDRDDGEDRSERADSTSQSEGQKDQDDSDYTDATSIASSPLLSAAATVLIDATQKLRRMHQAEASPIYLVKGDLTSLHDNASGYTDGSWPHYGHSHNNTKILRKRDAEEDNAEESSLATLLDVTSPALTQQVSESPSVLQSNGKAQSRFVAPPSSLILDAKEDQQMIRALSKLDTRPSRPTLARISTSEHSMTGLARAEGHSIPSLPLTTSKLASRNAASKMKLNEQPLTLVHPRLLSIPNRRGTEPGHLKGSPIDPSHSDSDGHPRSLSLLTGKSVTDSFEASEIIEGFLFLGPDITTVSELNHLKDIHGIKCILNAAIEIEEGGGKHLNLHQRESSGIEKYKKIALKDVVEGQEIQSVMDESCAFIDEARLTSSPIYVHCKAGKSRSVMLVMAYLIHSNRWTLQEAYAYVVERRREVSPNIGFVAELMAFEKRTLQRSTSTAPNVADV